MGFFAIILINIFYWSWPLVLDPWTNRAHPAKN